MPSYRARADRVAKAEAQGRPWDHRDWEEEMEVVPTESCGEPFPALCWEPEACVQCQLQKGHEGAHEGEYEDEDGIYHLMWE